MRLTRILAIAALAVAAMPAAGVYTEPTRRIVLNEVVDVPQSEPAIYDLYLSRGGRYYTELYLEPRSDESRLAHREPVELTVAITVTRRDRIVHSEQVPVHVAPGEIHQTLLWAKSPWDWPQRKNMQVSFTVQSANAAFRDHYDQVRFADQTQIRIRADLSLRSRWR